MGDNYENFYNGGASSFESSYGKADGSFIGYHSPSFSTNLGFPGSAQTANQLKETVNAIKQGVKAFEITMVSPETADQIPKQHFSEIRALMKLSGVSPSVHAPIMDPAGFGQQGYHESSREEAERKLFNVLEKARELNPDGNIPVVLHSSGGVPGNEYSPGKEEGDRYHIKKMILVDRETGQLATEVKEERKFYPTRPEDFEKGGTLHKPMDEIETVNASKWQQTMTGLAQFTKMTDEVIGENIQILAPYKDEKITQEVIERMSPEEQHAFQKLRDANIFLHNANLNFNGAFNTAYKYGNEEQKEALTKIAEDFRKRAKSARGNVAEVALHREALSQAIQGLDAVTTGVEVKNPYTGEMMPGVPLELVPVEDFAREKAAQTFGNIAFKSYKELGGDKAPVIAIENMYQGMAFAKPEDLKKLINESRDVFVKNALAKGMKESEAEKAAEKLIGVTWDVGHLNMMKKFGFEDKDVVDATSKMKDYIKHVHLTDNFGYSDSHLAPGMGNVPIKDILKELEKTGRLSDMKKIVEAPGFFQHFQRSPHSWTLGALGAPIYGSSQGGGGPYWNQVTSIPVGGGYFGGPMAYMPEKHFSMYGTGFSSLPTELGGQIPGTQSRFSGTPTA
jgi:sugar phosphate isomerase/epimerase